MHRHSASLLLVAAAGCGWLLLLLLPMQPQGKELDSIGHVSDMCPGIDVFKCWWISSGYVGRLKAKTAACKPLHVLEDFVQSAVLTNRVSTNMHACIHTHKGMPTLMHAYMHMHACTHAHMPTHMHTLLCLWSSLIQNHNVELLIAIFSLFLC